MIKNQQDFWGGLGLVTFAAAAWWLSSDLPGQEGFMLGPGSIPRLFIALIFALAVCITARAMLAAGPGLERWNIRGPVFVLGAIILFAVSVKPLGLVLATFALVMVSSLGSRETRWIETTAWGIAVAAFCAVLFPYVLNLPMQLWPRF